MPSVIFASVAPAAGKSAIAAAVAELIAADGRAVVASSSLQGDGEPAENVEYVDASDADGLPQPLPDAIGIFEGRAGGSDADVADAERLDALVVLVAGFGDDVVKHAARYGDRLAGVVWNKVPRYRTHDLKAACAELADAGVKCLGYLPEDRALAAHSLAEIAELIGADTVVESRAADPLIETFLIGGLVLDWGPTYFDSEPETCVIVRSGRPDVQISALQSDNTRAVVMTGGGKPIDYVYYEARAKNIPLLVAKDDTEQVMARLDDSEPSGFSHRRKQARMQELLREGAILDGILELTAAPATR